MTTPTENQIDFDYTKYGFRDEENYTYKSEKGLNEEVVRTLSKMKGEPEWMLKLRLKSLEIFNRKPMPLTGMWANPKLAELDFQDIFYYVRPGEKVEKSWDDVPENIKNTFEKLGIPEAEQKFLAGVGAQYECLSGDSRVFTDKGLVPIRDIQPGDVVFSFDEETNSIIAAEVRATASKGEREVFEVRVGTRSIKATSNHPFLMPQRGWTYLHELSPGDMVGVATDFLAANEANHAEVPMRLASRHSVEQEIYIPAAFHTAFDGYVKIDSITPAGVEMVYDIEVDGPHNFVAEGMIVHNSEVVYHSLREEWSKLGVIFLDTDTALKEQPEMFREYFGTIIPAADNKFAALNTAVWSGGSFIYVPKGVKVDIPLQAYFRINAENMGQFERTLIIVDEGAEAHYIEGCFTAGAQVQTRNGLKPIETIIAGEEVLTHKGRYCRVNTTMHRPHEGKLYNIRYAGSNTVLHVTPEHPFMALRADKLTLIDAPQPEWLLASMLKEGDYLVIPMSAIKDGTIRLNNPAPSTGGAMQQEYATHHDNHFMYVPVHEIIVTDVQTEIFNLSVEQDESYVCEGVVSHNCTAPVYTTNSLHSAVVEIIVKKGAKFRYTTIQNWSNNIFNLVTKRAVAYEDASMEWVDGNIGCLAEGSTVTTPQGLKTIEALEPGEEVLSYDDRSGEFVFRKVLAKRFSGYQAVHDVSVGERKLTVTANHPFYSYTYNPDAAKKLGRYNLAYVRADQLKEAIIPRTSIDYGAPYQLQKPWLVTEFQSNNQYADNLTMSRTRQSRLAEIETTTDETMWLFGYWIGDGDIEVKAGKTEGVTRFAKVGFSTPPTDRARGRLLETMANLIDSQPTERADTHHLAWNSKELAELFKLNGFEGKARTKRVPTWVWSLPESQRLAFVAGYLDADGMVVDSKRRFSLKSANRELLSDIASILVTLGITSRLYTEFSEPRTVTILGYECTAHGSYSLSFPLDERLVAHVSPQLRDAAVACEPAKAIHNRLVGRSQIRLPESVEIVNVVVSEASGEPVPTWDIEVEDTGNFVSQGFIVHNSRLTMKYPAVYMLGRGAKGEVLSVAYAGEGQHQDAGAKMVHAAPDTTSRITNKSVSKNGGRTTYRGLAKILPGATNAKINVVCDALILDDRSASDTIPYIEIEEDSATVAHEATVGKIGEEQLFYLMSRGLDESEALSMIVLGFMEPFTRELPMEYSVELNRLIQMEMEGSVG